MEIGIVRSLSGGVNALRLFCRVALCWIKRAAALLAANDVGLIPWVLLTRFSTPPKQLLRQCRDRIDRQAKPDEHEAMLTVTTLLSTVVFDDEALFAIFGGTENMIESPFMDRLLAKRDRQTKQSDILEVLETRFGNIPTDLAEKLRTVDEMAHLKGLNAFSGTCPDLEAFRSRLAAAA